MLELLLVRKILYFVYSFWNALPASVKVLIIVLIALGGGFIWGSHREKEIYEAKISASIEQAKQIDKAANDNAAVQMTTEKNRWQKQALEFENKLNESAVEYSKLKDQCRADPEFIKRNNEIDDLLYNSKKKGK